MNIFENTPKLRGFLVKDAEVPSSDGITENAFAVLYLATMSGTWDIAINQWAQHHDSPGRLPWPVVLRLHSRDEARRLCRSRR